jgi:CheY-like chemotaxis protein
MNEKKVILLIDDDEIQFSFVEHMLKNEYKIIAVKSGEEALEYLSGGLVPFLIFLDILMPDMDGWETFNRIKVMSFLQNVPIVFLTSLDRMEEKQRGLAMGAADYIIKPYTRTELKNAIKAIETKKKR